LPIVTLVAHISEWNGYFRDWIAKYPNCNISLISCETAISVSRLLARNRAMLSTADVVQTLQGFMSALKIKDISVINAESFYLASCIMPDDDFHRKFANRFYGREFAHLVRFEDIWSRYGKPETPTYGLQLVSVQ
jgi:hypothetical protein